MYFREFREIDWLSQPIPMSLHAHIYNSNSWSSAYAVSWYHNAQRVLVNHNSQQNINPRSGSSAGLISSPVRRSELFSRIDFSPTFSSLRWKSLGRVIHNANSVRHRLPG